MIKKKQLVAMISGVTGQIGSYLAEILLEKGYKVIGLKRRTSLICTDRIDHIFQNKNFHLEYFDLLDTTCLRPLLEKYKPDEFYNFAAMSHVKVSFEQPEYTAKTVGLAVLNILETIRQFDKSIKFYQASTSEMFGQSKDFKQPKYPGTPSPYTIRNEIPRFNEDSKFDPVSPYACAKVFAHNCVANYRRAYDMFACSGIMFNAESERRGETFVTRKITKGIADIIYKNKNYINLGNLDAIRDWSYAKDTAKAAYLMLQADEPKDYIIASGNSYTIKDFLGIAFYYVDIKNWQDYVKIDTKYYRPCEVPYLCGDPSKIMKELGWRKTKSFIELVESMVAKDLDKAMIEEI